jgi:hypothetical protein
MRCIAAVGLVISLSAPSTSAALVAPDTIVNAPVPGEALIGRWDLTLTEGNRPSWFEVKLSGFRTLVGSFVSHSGSARPVSLVTATDNSFRFAVPPQWEQGSGELVVEGTMADGKISGTITEPSGSKSAFTGVRAPSLVRDGVVRWGTPITLFNGRDLSGWKASAGTNQWKVINGLLTNTASGANLITERTFTDFKLHVEFRVPKNGNSGIYLRGRHELQVEDSKGMEPYSTHTGGVYGFIAPNTNAALDAGTWQTYDVTLVGRLITVVLNGKTVISMQVIPGITGGALDSREGEPGPIYLQGDHTSVEYRKVVLTPAR